MLAQHAVPQAIALLAPNFDTFDIDSRRIDDTKMLGREQTVVGFRSTIRIASPYADDGRLRFK